MTNTKKIVLAGLALTAGVLWTAGIVQAAPPARIQEEIRGIGGHTLIGGSWIGSYGTDLRQYVGGYFYGIDSVPRGLPLGQSSYWYYPTKTRSPRRMSSARPGSEMALVSPRLVYFGPGNYYGQTSTFMTRIRNFALAGRLETGTISPALRMAPQAVGR